MSGGLRICLAIGGLAAALALPALAHAQPAPVAWCGTDEITPNRTPDLTIGPRIRVVYAVPSDALDRFAQFASGIATDAAAIDAWWRTQDPTRAPRFDRYPFPGCTTKFGDLDIGSIRLPRTTADYSKDSFGGIYTDVGPTLPNDQKTLVYYDGPPSNSRRCGESDSAPQFGSFRGISIIYLQADPLCRITPGTGYSAAVTAHELGHNLGAAPPEAPHLCEGAHICDPPYDLMFPIAQAPLDGLVLDYQHDDYYGHSGSWWDVQDSLWLMHLPERVLDVGVNGSGRVLVTVGAATSTACSAGCTGVEAEVGDVVLEADPEDGYQVGAWSGSCSGAAATCTVSGTADIAASVTFVRSPLKVRVRVQGKGRVTSVPAGLACTSTCSKTFPAKTKVRLVATPAKGWKLAAWSGGCYGKTCTVSDQADVAVARFVKR